jgi:DNA-binding LacI/PurR family transcriptional regulator
VLERHDIAFDQRLVLDGFFQWSYAVVAMEQFLQQGIEFDAVVAANDVTALAAIAMLRKCGHRVPEGVAVAGFDDLPLSRFENPPLTTVAQPYAFGQARARIGPRTNRRARGARD